MGEKERMHKKFTGQEVLEIFQSFINRTGKMPNWNDLQKLHKEDPGKCPSLGTISKMGGIPFFKKRAQGIPADQL